MATEGEAEAAPDVARPSVLPVLPELPVVVAESVIAAVDARTSALCRVPMPEAEFDDATASADTPAEDQGGGRGDGAAGSAGDDTSTSTSTSTTATATPGSATGASSRGDNNGRSGSAGGVSSGGFDINLVYGEIPVRSLMHVLNTALSLLPVPTTLAATEGGSEGSGKSSGKGKGAAALWAPDGRVFVDLGSGTGKATLAAAQLFPPAVFSRCVGIELLERHHRVAMAAKEALLADAASAAAATGDATEAATGAEAEAEAAAKAAAATAAGGVSRAELVSGSFLSSAASHDWSGALVVFCNATAFDFEVQEALSRRAEALRFGAIFVSTTNQLKTPLFETVRTERVPMSWGPATVYYQRRKRLGKWVAGVLGRK